MNNTIATRLIFEQSQPGRRSVSWPAAPLADVPLQDLIPAASLAASPPPLPEVGEPDVVRHFVNLSTQNMSVDSHFYPLGSCTMKYNPKRHERWAKLPGIIDVHPLQRDEDLQGLLGILYELQEMLAEIAGLPCVSLQPAAGAQGELTALLVAKAYFRSRGEDRTTVLFPANAHGTNPASAAAAGLTCRQLAGGPDGLLDLEELQRAVNSQTAVFMITNPSTLGLFEPRIAEAARMVHAAGGLVYIDGANMNAIMGITRPGDFGGDMMHYNVHKTFTGPHGAGGPGAGPIVVRDFLGPFLPGPVVVREEQNGETVYRRQTPASSIGRVRTFFGNVGILLRGYFYLRTLGARGVRDAAEQAVLNANYLKSSLADVLPARYGRYCLHEFVASAQQILQQRGLSAMDIAKRLLDHGFHAPTVYFPLVVPEALMIEPTETESLATLDAFVDALRTIILEEDPAVVKSAPQTTPVCRPDEVRAARQPMMCWTCPSDEAIVK